MGHLQQMRCGVVRSNQVRPHGRTRQYALVYIVDGTGVYCDANGQEFELETGCFFQRFPDEPHWVSWDQAVQAYIAIPRAALDVLRMTSRLQMSYVCMAEGEPMEIVQRFFTIIDHLEDSTIDSLAVLVEMLELIRDMHGAVTAPPTSPHRGLMDRACRMLADDFSVQARIGEVAQAVGMSVSGFHKAFKEHTHLSPGQYRIRKRVDMAAEYIVNSGQTFTDIAQELGYADLYTFSSQFKKVTGLSPTEYRNRYAGD